MSGGAIAKQSHDGAVQTQEVNPVSRTAPWTRSEEKLLAALYEHGHTPAQLSEMLCRSVGSINGKLDYMLVERRTKYRAWTVPELRKALALREGGASFAAIGRELRRSATSVRHAVLKGLPE